MRSTLIATLIAALATPAMAEGAGDEASQERPPDNPAYATVDDVPGLPRVLLLGDSISIGYTLDVREALAGKANVHRPPENCGPTILGLIRLDDWLGDKPWDVIHVNFGLHDLKYIDADGKNTAPGTGTRQVPLLAYERNLDRIATRLKQTGASIIFATTTPVPPGESQRRAGDEVAYNEVATRVMRRHGITINDLHAFIAPRFESVAIRPGDVHFTDEGSKFLADRVAEAIEAALRARR